MKSKEGSAWQPEGGSRFATALVAIGSVKMGMKRSLLSAALFTLLFSLLTSPAAAQVGEHRDEFAVGVSGGIVMSSISFVPTVPQKQLFGKTGGITLRYTTEKYFNSVCAIVCEVNYAQLGWKEDILNYKDDPVINTVTGEPEEYERRINYIQVPLLARLGWGRERKGAQFFFQIGPQMGFYLSESTKMNYTPETRNDEMRVSTVVEQESMPVENKFDYGITGGIGLEYSIPKAGHIMLEARYYYGLGNIYGNTKRDYFARSNFSNIVIKASYLFDIVKSKNNKIK